MEHTYAFGDLELPISINALRQTLFWELPLDSVDRYVELLDGKRIKLFYHYGMLIHLKTAKKLSSVTCILGLMIGEIL